MLGSGRVRARLRETHGLTRADDAGRIWFDGTQVAFFGEAWGGLEYWSDERSGGGNWLRADSAFLSGLLSKTDLILAGFIQARMHRRGERTKANDRMVRRTFGYLIDKSGRVTVTKQIPKKIREAVNRLDRYSKFDFSKRFSVILQHL